MSLWGHHISLASLLAAYVGNHYLHTCAQSHQHVSLPVSAPCWGQTELVDRHVMAVARGEMLDLVAWACVMLSVYLREETQGIKRSGFDAASCSLLKVVICLAWAEDQNNSGMLSLSS